MEPNWPIAVAVAAAAVAPSWLDHINSGIATTGSSCNSASSSRASCGSHPLTSPTPGMPSPGPILLVEGPPVRFALPLPFDS